jgi:hypothetical protein
MVEASMVCEEAALNILGIDFARDERLDSLLIIRNSAIRLRLYWQLRQAEAILDQYYPEWRQPEPSKALAMDNPGVEVLNEHQLADGWTSILLYRRRTGTYAVARWDPRRGFRAVIACTGGIRHAHRVFERMKTGGAR